METGRREQWWRAGEDRLATLVAGLDDDDFARPSLLPGWTRQVLIAHVARNAAALVHLLDWARTGVPTPMYASAADREAGIAATAALAVPDLHAELAATREMLAHAVSDLPDAAWAAPVRTAQGREVPAREVLWMRCREVWVHAVDLDTGFTFADVPAPIAASLLDDVFAMWAGRPNPPDLDLVATDTGGHWVGRAGSGAAVAVWAPQADLAAWVTGRGPLPDPAAAAVPPLPVWL